MGAERHVRAHAEGGIVVAQRLLKFVEVGKRFPEHLRFKAPPRFHDAPGVGGLSPGGAAEACRRVTRLSRPSGTRVNAFPNPTLKRWAIAGCPSGTEAAFSARRDSVLPSNVRS